MTSMSTLWQSNIRVLDREAEWLEPLLVVIGLLVCFLCWGNISLFAEHNHWTEGKSSAYICETSKHQTFKDDCPYKNTSHWKVGPTVISTPNIQSNLANNYLPWFKIAQYIYGMRSQDKHNILYLRSRCSHWLLEDKDFTYTKLLT